MNENKLSFANLDATRFEEFSSALLEKLGFIDVDWRKGTPLGSSPSDQGRDIEAKLQSQDVDGTVRSERWFVECKHYARGVPAEKIQGALAWAASERPDVLVFCVSGFLSNSAKSFVTNYIKNNKPHFLIKIWERPQLESFVKSVRRQGFWDQ